MAYPFVPWLPLLSQRWHSRAYGRCDGSPQCRDLRGRHAYGWQIEHISSYLHHHIATRTTAADANFSYGDTGLLLHNFLNAAQFETESFKNCPVNMCSCMDIAKSDDRTCLLYTSDAADE